MTSNTFQLVKMKAVKSKEERLIIVKSQADAPDGPRWSILDVLTCPACLCEDSALERKNGMLVCPCCAAEYHYRNKIPVMVPTNQSKAWIEDARRYARMLDGYYAMRIDKGDGWWVPEGNPYKRLGIDYNLKAGRWLATEAMAASAEKGVILSVGSGDGFGLKDLLKRNDKLQGIALDLSNVILSHGRECHGDENLHFVTGTVENIPFAPNSIDGAIVLEVIEHVRGVPVFLSSLHRVLKSGARVCITTPNRRGLAFWWDVCGRHHLLNGLKRALRRKSFYTFSHPYGFLDTDEAYERILSPKELKAMLEKAGFHVERRLATQWLGESFPAYLEALKIPLWFEKILIGIFLSLERLFASLLPSFYVGFTQVVIARKE